jgi:hypothetical protein
MAPIILLEQLQEGAHTFQFIGINDLESTVQDFRERARQEFQGFGLSEYVSSTSSVIRNDSRRSTAFVQPLLLQLAITTMNGLRRSLR